MTARHVELVPAEDPEPSGMTPVDCAECWDSFDVPVVNGRIVLPPGWVWAEQTKPRAAQHRLRPICDACVAEGSGVRRCR